MKNKLPTVTVGLAVYNEEKNIVNLIISILNQKPLGFKLKQILIISDGSSDNTVSLINALNNSIIKVVDSKKRLGQPSRLNQVYRLFRSDYLIQTDGDAVFSHDKVISNVVKLFKSDNKIAMIGGNVSPIKPKNFVQSSVIVSNRIFKNAGEEYRNGNNIFTVHGPFIAFTNAFAKSVHLPADIIASDKYMYLECRLANKIYLFTRNSGVFFELPLTLKDQIKQNTRFKVAKHLLSQYFPDNFVQKEYSLPKKYIIKRLITEVLRNPLPLVVIFIINRYCKLLAKISQSNFKNILWDKLERTKVLTT